LLATLPGIAMPRVIWCALDDSLRGGLTAAPFFFIASAVWLGLKGRELAWKNCRWDDLEHFNRVQHKRALAGIWTCTVLCVVAAPFVLWLAFMSWALDGKIG
jgi:hypothetical protein